MYSACQLPRLFPIYIKSDSTIFKIALNVAKYSAAMQWVYKEGLFLLASTASEDNRDLTQTDNIRKEILSSSALKFSLLHN